jgi:RNA polymerase sigma factor (sigma-70 family)
MVETNEILELLIAVRKQSSAQGNERAWAALRGYVDSVVRLRFQGSSRRGIDQSDIVQQSMIDVQRCCDRLEATTERQAKQWLLRVIENNWIDAQRRFYAAQCRSLRSEKSLTIQEANQIVDRFATTASHGFMLSEQRLKLLQAISLLSEAEREILENRHKSRLSFVQIGERLGITEQAARKRWNRILVKLRNEIGNDESSF